MANNRDPYILMTIYQNLYKDRYGKMPSLNKFREKWAMQDVIESIGFERAKELLDYYFKTNKMGHPLNFFYNNFDKIDVLNKEIKKDKLNRSILLNKTKNMVEGKE